MYLHNNNITDIPANAFSNQPKLSILPLYSNRISIVSSTAFRGLANLNTLYLYNNQLTELHDYLFFGLSSLNNLQLQNNAILQIFPNTFTGISSLTYLLLYGNSLKTFPSEALSKISSIAVLYLQNNQMTTLPLAAYDMLSSVSSTIDISNNPWQCDCRMVGFRQKMTGSPSFENRITCTDSHSHGQLLKDINPEDLTCEEPMIVRFEKGDDNSLVEGEILHLVCEASGIPTPDITVIHPSGLNVTVESGGRVTVTVNNTITVTDVTAADAGLYICIARSPVGSAFETLSIDVQLKELPTITMSPPNVTGTSDKPESTSNHGSVPSFSLPVLLGSVFGAVAGTVLIVGIILMIWYKRRTQNPPSGSDVSVVFNNKNTTATVKISGHDKKGQDEAQNVSHPRYNKRPAVPQPTLDVFEDVDHVDQSSSNQRPKGAGPSQPGKKKAAAQANRNKAPVTTSGHYQSKNVKKTHHDQTPLPTLDLYEDVDYAHQSLSNQRPKSAGTSQSAKKKAAAQTKMNRTLGDERPPPPPPPPTGAAAGAAAVYANEPAAASDGDLAYYLPVKQT
ncbi:leucine-rich repeat-containing protein 24-like [Branchiostoma lanceolatum]|uniref:leucine-rich repeat-containing protein 24-like n=1 Tax=Branchiostoma lanceolatum TaxID=7740 RepID=UPI0034522220